MPRVALSTADNPYNPITQFSDWLDYDEAHGYYTCAYLARIAVSSDELSEAEQATAEEQAIDEIVRYNLLGNYIKVTEGQVIDVNDQEDSDESDSSDDSSSEDNS